MHLQTFILSFPKQKQFKNRFPSATINEVFDFQEKEQLFMFFQNTQKDASNTSKK